MRDNIFTKVNVYCGAGIILGLFFSRTLLEASAVISIIFYIVFKIRKREKLNMGEYAVILFLLVALLSAMLSPFRKEALDGYRRTFPYLLLIPSFTSIKERRLEIYSFLFICVGFIAAIIGMVGKIYGDSFFNVYGMLPLVFANLMLIPYAFSIYLVRKKRIPGIILTLFFLVVIFFTKRFSAIIGVVIIPIILLILINKRFLLLLLLLPGLFFLRNIGGDKNRFSGRKKLFLSGLKMIERRPVLGFGSSSIRPYYEKYSIPYVIPYKLGDFQNSYIQIGFGTGILGLVIFLFSIFYYLIKGFKKLKLRRDKLLYIDVFVILVMIIINANFIYSFGSPQLSIPFYLLLGIFGN